MTLGEGPTWDARNASLWFVDIKQRNIHCLATDRLDTEQDAVTSWSTPEQAGWLFPTDSGKLIVGMQSGIALFDPATGQFTHILDVEPEHPSNRLNDAVVSADGSIWLGTMDDGESQPTGHFYHYTHATGLARTAIAPVPITNGPAISPDGMILYHVDTVGRTIYASDVTADGEIMSTRLFVAFTPADGNPDGISTDALGNVWVGMWGGWCARCYAPDGQLLQVVDMPVANITKIALGGPDLKTAFATTARLGLSDAELQEQPHAGALFSFDVDIPGWSAPYLPDPEIMDRLNSERPSHGR